MSNPGSPTSASNPIILTVALDPASQERFDRLRDRLFPAELNHLAAHVTMFHHLPGEYCGQLAECVAEVCREMPPAEFTVTNVRFLGRGSAFKLHMPEVAAVRQRLAGEWKSWLTAQDRQPWQPHVTVQNKVPPGYAREIFTDLQSQPLPAGGRATGLHLWAYLGGPWRSLSCYGFEGRR